ncbi:NUDIX domain-containing protein [Longispora albida]|uniref:NUDIX domain-containing protein n=1 Tax=Longispora albida TaxID=203523 RepID=UPI0003681CC5|nr:NUDIX domain-containing protein [Longispora albida]
MKWTVHSERTLYQDQWVHLVSADVELPDGRHLDHRLMRSTAPSAGVVLLREGRVLLMWRHRFITDTWGWEIPIGGMNRGEVPVEAAARECEEETGWRPEGLRQLVYTQPSPGLMTSEHYVFLAESATYTGMPKDGFESERIEWVPLADIVTLIAKGDIVAGTTLVALLYAHATCSSAGERESG